MNKNSLLIGAALMGILSATACKKESSQMTPTPGVAGNGKCFGVNSCKGKGECSAQGHDCAGLNSCKGQGWMEMSPADCTAKNGKFEAM